MPDVDKNISDFEQFLDLVICIGFRSCSNRPRGLSGLELVLESFPASSFNMAFKTFQDKHYDEQWSCHICAGRHLGGAPMTTCISLQCRGHQLFTPHPLRGSVGHQFFGRLVRPNFVTPKFKKAVLRPYGALSAEHSNNEFVRVMIVQYREVLFCSRGLQPLIVFCAH